MRKQALFVMLAAMVTFPPSCSAADLQFDPRTAPADAQRLRDLIRKCERESAAFRELMDAIARSSQPITVFPGRDQSGVWVDRFSGGEINLKDLEAYANPKKDESGAWIFPPGVDREAATLCENLAHILYERFHANYVNGQYKPSHDAANSYESRIRREFGQTGSLIDCVDDNGDGVSIYRDDIFILERDPEVQRPGGKHDIGPIRVTRVKVFCVGRCAGPPPRRRVIAGADTCGDCEKELLRLCGGGLNSSGCRTR
jgi:hypothetical protein